MHNDQLPGYELQLIAKSLKQQGYDDRDLFGEAQGQFSKEFSTFPLRIAGELEKSLYKHFATLNRDPYLSISLGKKLDITHYGELGPLLAACDTVLEVLQFLVRFQPLVTSSLQLELQQRPEGPYLRMSFDGNVTAKDSVLEAETTMISLATVMDQVTCGEHKWLACFVAGEQTGEKRAALQAALQCPVVDRVSHWGLMIRSEDALRPLPLARAHAKHQLIELCITLIAEHTAPLSIERLVQQYLKLLTPFLPNAGHFASNHNMTERTLARQLKTQGTSWRECVDTERRERVDQALIQGLTIEHCAEKAGFKDPRSLTAAIRRWHQTTTNLYRKRLQEKQPMV